MKRWLFFFLIFCIILVSAKTEKTTLKIGDSLLIKGSNVTLIDTDDKEDKIIVCINNQKSIVSNEKIVNGVRVEILNVYNNYSRLRLENPCRDCICDESCSNELCFEKQQLECNTNLDCKDLDETTKDLCINNKCVHEKITTPKVEKPSEITISLKEKETRNNIAITTLFIITSIIILLIILKYRKII